MTTREATRRRLPFRRRGRAGLRDLGGRRAGRDARADPAPVRPAGAGQPRPDAGGGRRYSPRDVALLREVQRLSQEDGVNLAGIKRIIELESRVEALQARVHELLEELEVSESRRIAAEAAVSATYRRDLVPQRRPSTALVVWRPRTER